MANQTIKRPEAERDSRLNETDETNEIDHFFGLQDPVDPATSSEETRQAIHTIVNLAIFILLWVGTSVAAIMTDYPWYLKTAITLLAFPAWGHFINKFVIGWTAPIVGPKQPS